ncbi:uncharacterized protein J4E88_004044 [Alternaria novae-zelandiae]|uniref:uncharacterized protein n=1 Tax=Alternaria novae-zelandiae TaxID=430562 RepID=UPI0020C2DA8D|nr:uncharacterized protein J4E88_004044 [Alternaria novae-zelandiae]KAI4684604.1 hypothetical protein J4E88_004044 [Alternaria novae-zelandiae]
MKHTILSAVILLPLAYSRTAKELCRGTAELSSDGNWYCSEVWAITYRNISQPGAYNRTTTVDPKTGPPLQCLPTSGAASISGSTPPETNCTCDEDEDPEPIFQRPNGQVYVSPTPTLKHAPETSSTQDALPVSQHPDGQPFEVPSPSSSSPQDTLPVSQRPDGQLFDSPSPSPSSTQDIIPVSQLPDGQPIQFPSPSPSSMQGILTVSQRPDGQPIVPSPSPSSPQETLPVSQRPDGQPFDIPSPSPSPPQDPLPVSQRPDGQPFDIPSPSPSPVSKRQGSDWKRIAYYTSTSPAQATGLSFMANLGDPQKSGTFD